MVDSVMMTNRGNESFFK